jgi:hypothetical protein
VQEHKERQMAQGMDATVDALKSLFTNEKEAYDSLNQTYVTLAGSLARECLRRNLVDPASGLAPALQPFSLSAQLSSASDTSGLNAIISDQLNETSSLLVSAHASASTSMLQGITEMGTRIHQLATEGKMPARGTPISLANVENWITGVKTLPPGTTASSASATATSTNKAAKNVKK